MLLVNMQINIELPYIESKKGRRKIIHSIKDRLKPHNLSVLDISGEYNKEATLAVAFLSLNQKAVDSKIDKIEQILDRYISEIEYDIDYEIL